MSLPLSCISFVFAEAFLSLPAAHRCLDYACKAMRRSGEERSQLLKKLNTELSACRHYMSAEEADDNDNHFTFDPRFLLMEYMKGFVLRKKQVLCVL